MKVPSVESVTRQDQSLERLVVQEIDRQLHLVPDEIAQYIDHEYATLEVLKLLSPMEMQGYWQDNQPNKQFNQTLRMIIADATSLSLIRLVCHTAIADYSLPQKQLTG